MTGTTYTDVTFEPATGMRVCDDCGGLVRPEEEDHHAEWHEQLRQVLLHIPGIEPAPGT